MYATPFATIDASLFAAAVAAQTNVSPERPNKERELQTQLSSKDCEIRRLNDRLVSVSEQAAGSGRLLFELQQEKDRVRELTSEVQELQRQLLQQQDEIKTQNLQVMSLKTTTFHHMTHTLCLFRQILVSWSCSHSCKF